MLCQHTQNSGLVDFFGRANHSDHSGDSAFILHLRINDEAFELQSSDSDNDEHDDDTTNSSDDDSDNDDSDNSEINGNTTAADNSVDGSNNNKKQSKKARKSTATAASAVSQKPTATVMTIEPSLSDLQAHACSCVDKVVSSMQKFPRIDTLLKSQLLSTTVPRTSVLHSAISVSASKPLGPCTVVSTDSIVSDAKLAIKQSLAQHLVLPTGLIQSFQPFTPLLDGQESDYVTNVLNKRVKQGQSSAAVVQSLDTLKTVADRLRATAVAARRVVPDICCYPMFSVRCIEAKEALAKKAEALHVYILDAVAADNRAHMCTLCEQYQELVNSLVTEPADSQELKALQEFTLRSSDTLTRLLEEYTGQVFQRVIFLLNQGHRATRDDLQLLHTTFSWPHGVKSYMIRSNELQRARKRDLEMVVSVTT
jgi:hypothetical protein